MSKLVLEGVRADASKTDVLNVVLSFGIPIRIAQGVNSNSNSNSAITVEFSDPQAADMARRTLERYLPLLRERLGPTARAAHSSRSTQ